MRCNAAIGILIMVLLAWELAPIRAATSVDSRTDDYPTWALIHSSARRLCVSSCLLRDSARSSRPTRRN